MCNNKNNKIKKQKPNFLCKYYNNHIRLYGTSSNGKKRYRCMNCNKTFSIEEDKRIKYTPLERVLCLLDLLHKKFSTKNKYYKKDKDF